MTEIRIDKIGAATQWRTS